MSGFLQQHGKVVSGMVSGWDRLRFRGTLQRLCHPEGLNAFLRASGRLFKDFKDFAIWSGTQLKEAAMAVAKRLDRPCFYVPSARVSKEEMARQHAKDEGITQGLICCISAVEPCAAASSSAGTRAARGLRFSVPRVAASTSITITCTRSWGSCT